MAKKDNLKRIQRRGRNTAMLTKRILIRAAKAGIQEAAAETMKVMGCNVIAKNGWVVRIYADGRTERIGPITASKTGRRLILD